MRGLCCMCDCLMFSVVLCFYLATDSHCDVQGESK